MPVEKQSLHVPAGLGSVPWLCLGMIGKLFACSAGLKAGYMAYSETVQDCQLGN